MSHPYREPAVVEVEKGVRWGVTWRKRLIVRIARLTLHNYVWRIERAMARMKRANDKQIAKIEELRMQTIYTEFHMKKLEAAARMVKS